MLMRRFTVYNFITILSLSISYRNQFSVDLKLPLLLSVGVSWFSGICSFIGRFVFIRLGYSLVLDISDVSVFVGLIADDLSATVGKKNAVRSARNLTVVFVLVSEIIVSGIVLHGPREFMGHAGLLENENVN